MRLHTAVLSVVAAVVSLVLLVRGRPLVRRRPADPGMVRAVAVTILAISLSTLAGYVLGAWAIAYLLVALGVIAFMVALVIAVRVAGQ